MPVYHIRVQGHLADHYAAWFDPLTITCEPSGETLLAGELIDQGALFGILLKIRDLGLPLLTVSPNPDWDKEVVLMTTEQITVTGFMTIQPGTEQILLKEIDALVAKTRAEPGCISYDFYQHKTDSHRFVFFENFADQAAFDDHFTQPYTKEWIALAESHGARFDIQFWKMLSQPERAR